MKKLQYLVAVILCLVTAIIGTVGVKAAAYPTKLSGIKKGAILKYNGYDSLYYKTNSNYKIFCTTFHTKGVGSSCSIASSQWSEPVQAGVAAIIKKYNSNKSQKNYYNAELAINEFLYYYSGKNSVNRISTTRDVRNTSGVKTYYNEAVSAYNKVNKKFSFKITNKSLTFSESGNYYVSNKITVKDENGNLSSYEPTVSGAKDAKIYNKSGNSFYIRVPKSSVAIGKSVKVKVSVTGVKSYSVAKRFECGSGNQKVTPNTTTTAKKTMKDSISGTITKKGNKLIIYKRIAGTKTNLAGAKLKLVSSNGKFSKTWTSTKDGKEFTNLEAGTYILSEVSAPVGYVKSSKEIKIKVELNGKTQNYTIENTQKKITTVKAIKLDAETKESLKGAELVVKDSKGSTVDSWTTDGKEHTIENLVKGDYTLSEKSAPEGYVKTDAIQSFKVDNDEKTVKLEVLNTKVKTKAEIIKIDSKTKKPVAGATLVIKNSDNKVVDTWESTLEAHEVTGLAKGTYTLSETAAPKGYELSKEEIKFEIKYDGKVVKVEMENKPVEIPTKARISKQSVSTGKELPGAHLVIRNSNGEIVKEWVSTNEPQEFELDPGVYTLSETIAPEGYQLKTETIEFEVKEDGTVTEVVMYNSPLEIPPEEPNVPTDVPKYKVSISKQDITTKSELPGATLVVKDSDGNEIMRWVSGNTPKEFYLPAGDYTLTEIQAPNGYDLSYEVISFTVKADNTVTTEAVMYNSKTPDTADKNIVLIFMGLLTTGFGTLFGYRKFKSQL